MSTTSFFGGKFFGGAFFRPGDFFEKPFFDGDFFGVVESSAVEPSTQLVVTKWDVQLVGKKKRKRLNSLLLLLQ